MQYLLGEIDQQDKQKVELWLNSSAKNRLHLDKLETVWSEAGKLTPAPVAVDVSNAWHKMSERIDSFEEEHEQKAAVQVSLKTRVVRLALRVAAVVILAFGIYYLTNLPDWGTEQIVLTGTLQPVKDTLPDGSLIALNSSSTLTYPEKFKKGKREVILEGEAFFDVEHNAANPFIIQAGEATIEVLGTSFNVKAYPGKNLEVSVVSGVVKLSKINKETGSAASVKLPAGKKGVLPVNAEKPDVVDEKLSDEIFWVNRTLIFENTELQLVFRMLEDNYNVKIEVSDSTIYNCRYSSTFEDATIDDILNVIAVSFKLELERDNKTYLLKGRGCSNEE
jgi:ferric-dicitrate binding protein FerR (iron transport regulator)